MHISLFYGTVDLLYNSIYYISISIYIYIINISGLYPHRLITQVGCVMMLLRNLKPKKDLCNGTKILIMFMT